MTFSASSTRDRLLLIGLVSLGLAGVYLAWRTEAPPPTSKLARPSETSHAPSVSRPAAIHAPFTAPSADHVQPARLNDSPLPEREYLEQLRALNHTDKTAALTLAEKGEHWYADTGSYAEARRAMRITLLVDLNRTLEARTFTREFIAQYPESPYRRLVQGVTGIHPRPSGPRHTQGAR